jgi:eukaryotic-like serine/threonine-protein kinase
MAVAAGTRLGPYEVLSPLGAGGMGEVYRARDSRLGREVAVKVLPEAFATSDERLRRFEREVSVTGALNHPNIVAVHDVGSHEGRPYVVYELLEGRTLREVLQAASRPTARKSAELALQMARGLAAAHEKGIVHRDLKPENLFVAPDGRLKILDFGLAKREDDGDVPPASDAADLDLSAQPTEPWHTSPGMRLGTLAYMSPEQVRGVPIDHRADIFSFGAVLYEMLSGTPAFLRPTRSETLAAILAEDPPGLSDHGPAPPPALQALVWRCLEKAPGERFQAARDLAFALETMLSGSEPSDRASGGSGSRRRRPALLASGAVLLAVVATVGLVLWSPRAGPGGLPDWVPRQLTSDPGWEAEPSLSADGSLVAYTSSRSGNADVWVVDARGGTSLRLTDDPASDRSPAWFPDGSALAFVSDRLGENGIWKVPRLGGLAVLLVPDAEDPAVSPDGTRIAFSRRDRSGQPRIAVAPLADVSHPTVLTGDDDGAWEHRHPAWSPDGTTLCYADFRDLWLAPAGGGRTRRLTSDHAKDAHPAWSADGRHVYFSSWRDRTLALWRVAATGGPPVRMSLGTGPEAEPSLSRDGTRLAYSTHAVQTDIVLLDTRTHERHEVPGFLEASTPAISPDGGRVVFTSERNGATDLWVQPLSHGRPEGGPLRLTGEPGNEVVPAVSPDGRWIAYGRVLGERRDICVIPASGGRPVTFSNGPGLEMHPTWSPDGSRLAFVSDRGGGSHVWVRGVRDGAPVGGARQLTSGEGADVLPAWSPDGSTIALIRSQGTATEVWSVGTEAPFVARRLTRGADARFVRWEAATRSLLVSGMWGTRTVGLRRVSAPGGEATAFAPAVDLGDPDAFGDFDLSADGRLLAFVRYQRRGDVWLLETARRPF